MTGSDTGARMPAGALVAAAGREVVALGAVVEMVHGLVTRHAVADAPSMEEAQSLDFLLQHLDAIGDLLQRLGLDPTLDGLVETDPLRAATPLADLAARLFDDADARPFARPSAGEVELF
jgi:hypothetical protein